MEEPKGLKVIAERLNLSESTVSRLNDYRDISARTKRASVMRQTSGL